MIPCPNLAPPAEPDRARSKWLVAFAGGLVLLASSPALAQGGERRDSVGDDAVDAVTQPLTDLNLRSREIPLLLLRAQAEPYDLVVTGDCTALRLEIADLDAVLGPDADSPQEEKGLANSALDLGGKLLGGLIPFRGLVRQISGAEAQDDRWEAAIYGGVARRSFLKGYSTARNCPVLGEPELQQARDEAAVRASGELLGIPATTAETEPAATSE